MYVFFHVYNLLDLSNLRCIGYECRDFSLGNTAKIFLIKYYVIQQSQKNYHTNPADVPPKDSEDLFNFLPARQDGSKHFLILFFCKTGQPNTVFF